MPKVSQLAKVIAQQQAEVEAKQQRIGVLQAEIGLLQAVIAQLRSTQRTRTPKATKTLAEKTRKSVDQIEAKVASVHQAATEAFSEANATNAKIQDLNERLQAAKGTEG